VRKDIIVFAHWRETATAQNTSKASTNATIVLDTESEPGWLLLSSALVTAHPRRLTDSHVAGISMADNRTAQQRSANMRAVRAKNTAPELLIRSLLHRLGYRFRLHRRDLPGTPDIVLPARRSVIFVNGCFWHGHRCGRGSLPTSNCAFWEKKIAENRKRDGRARKKLRSAGWRVLVIWLCQTKDRTKLLKTLTRFLQPGGNGR
jgi:DNA mismatch endonuclease (patch repair protein)